MTFAIEKMISSFLLQTCFLWAILKVQLSRSPAGATCCLVVLLLLFIMKNWSNICRSFAADLAPVFLYYLLSRSLAPLLFLYCKYVWWIMGHILNGKHIFENSFSTMRRVEKKRSKLRSQLLLLRKI